MKLYVTRHGQTNWNVEKKVMGRQDEPLNEEGRKQAEKTRDKLLNIQVDIILCSPLTRAKETAKIINENKTIPILYDKRILERSFGEFEGLKTSEFDFYGYWDYYKNEKYEKAENIQDFFKRIYEFLDDIKEKYKDKTVLIVTHGGVSIPIACYFNHTIPKESLVDAGLVLENCQIANYSTEE